MPPIIFIFVAVWKCKLVLTGTTFSRLGVAAVNVHPVSAGTTIIESSAGSSHVRRLGLALVRFPGGEQHSVISVLLY